MVRTLPSHLRFDSAPLFGVLAIVSILPLVSYSDQLSWHDQQRAGQIVAIAWAALYALHVRCSRDARPLLNQGARRLLVLIFFVGLISSVWARQPLWAFAELSIAVGCLGVAWLVASSRRALGAKGDSILMWGATLVCGALVVQFLVAYSALLITRQGEADPWLLLSGFSNLRFYGQFVTLTLPLIVLPLLVRGVPRWGVSLVLAVFMLWWCIAFMSGTRGTWLGMLVAALCLAFAGLNGRRWAIWQLIGACGGACLAFLFLDFLPSLLDIGVSNHPAGRATTSLSAREVIWLQAVEMIQARPLIGFGPMHFADVINPVAAHPHQAWLQVAAEWGVPVALVLTWMIGAGLVKVFGVARNQGVVVSRENILKVCLLGSVLAALTQSMVDGVFVMPYSQLWLAIVSGWLFGLLPCRNIGPTLVAGKVGALVWRVALICSSTFLLFILVRDFGVLRAQQDQYAQTVGGHLQPRFWSQGVIAERE